MLENKLGCWNLLSEKKKSPDEMYLILHSYPSDHIKTKNKGKVQYAEPYNNFVVDWKEVKKAVGWFCSSENCPLGIVRFKDDLAYKRKLIKEDPYLFRGTSPDLIQRMCVDISESEKKCIEELYERVNKHKRRENNDITLR